MGFLKRLFGGRDEPEQQPAPRRRQPGISGETLTDEQAIERYRYMLRTAPPEAIEQAHEEAFARLTPEQRAMVLRELQATMPEHERSMAQAQQDDPRTLARMATRAELRQPGTMERTFNRPEYGTAGFGGGMFGGSIFSSLAAGFVGSMVANQLYDSFTNDHGSDTGDPSSETGDPGADNEYGATEVGMDESLDAQGGDFGGFGGDGGGDFGGGDFGGDFGGGDF